MTTARRFHHMPFGAEPLEDGGVRFRLWAPQAARVDVCLQHHDAGTLRTKALPMSAEPGGWFSLTTGMARAGDHYRFRIDAGREVPDPASRFQPQDVHGPSEVIDPGSWAWRDTGWYGRRWEETVLYELHVGSFTPRGTFAAVQEKLDYLVALGITAIELMPVADFPGARNWGYDGACLFAPDSCYGRPDDLKSLIDAAHARNLMVFLDVVYNHFGPEGNYLGVYAPQFFTGRHRTPWGDAINYDGEDSEQVRQFFVHNALYWLEEFHLDGLRLDAVHAILDDSRPDILGELCACVRRRFGEQRHIHLVLENDNNEPRYLARDAAHRQSGYSAQWNDDFHHALHVLLTNEAGGYYLDYAGNPLQYLCRCLQEGFAYQGEPSMFREHAPRGAPSACLPATAFVTFLQNHDQVGNRAFGERINVLVEAAPIRAALTLLLLAPSPPLLFMGQEWGCRQPFLFFCDFGPELREAVVAGRRNEFARFAEFSDPDARARIPDPTARQSFASAVLDWPAAERPAGEHWLELHRKLLTLRQRELVPRLYDMDGNNGACSVLAERVLSAQWRLGDGCELFLLANLGDESVTGIQRPAIPVWYATHAESLLQPGAAVCLPPWSVIWYLQQPGSIT